MVILAPIPVETGGRIGPFSFKARVQFLKGPISTGMERNSKLLK